MGPFALIPWVLRGEGTGIVSFRDTEQVRAQSLTLRLPESNHQALLQERAAILEAYAETGMSLHACIQDR